VRVFFFVVVFFALLTGVIEFVIGIMLILILVLPLKCDRRRL
jgi:hypothetical protein